MVAHPSSERRQALKNLQIGWANVGKSSPKHSIMLENAYQEGIDILCIQEPFTFLGSRTVNHPGYDTHPPTDAWNDPLTWVQDRPRVMTYTRKGAGLKTTPRHSPPNRDRMWIFVNGFSILNIYRQPQTVDLLEYVTHLSPPSSCLVGGDFNAKHETFEPGVQASQGGAELANWACESNMDFIGEPGKATHRAGHVIDLTFSNIPFAKTLVRSDLDCGSDHIPLVTTIPGRGVPSHDQFRYRIPLANLPKFADIIEQSIGQVPNPKKAKTQQEIEQCVEALTKVFTDAIQLTGKPDRVTGRAAPWWTPDCAQARDRHRQSLTESDRRTPTVETRTFLATVRQAKKDYWRKIIDEIQDDKDLYKLVGWHKFEPLNRESPLLVDGQYVTDPQQKAEALRKAILDRFNSDDDLDKPPDGQDDPRLPWRQWTSIEEVERSTIKVSSTAPGTDGVTVRLLRACWPTVKNRIHGIYSKCLELSYFPQAWKQGEVAMTPKVGKKDRSSVRSWRPIALLSCLGKGLERIIAKRLAWTAMTNGIISPQHGGALPKRSAMDLIAAFTHDVEQAFARGQHVTMVTLDVQGAFDALLKNKLLHRMKGQGWRTETLQLVNSFLSDREVRVRLNKETTPFHTVRCGTPQGSPLSPVLYTLYLAELLNQDTARRFGYADDINIFRTSHSLDENVGKLAQDLRDIYAWGDTNKIAFAPEKVELLHLTRQKGDYAPACTVDDQLTIQPTPKDGALRWLGVWFDRKLKFKTHVAARAAKARKVAQHIRSLARVKYGPPAAALRKAVVTCVLPSLLYGAEAWYGGRTKPPRIMRATRKKEVSTRMGWHISMIDKIIALAARGVLPSFRTTPTATIFRDAGLPSGAVALEEAKLRFATHLQSTDNLHPLTPRTMVPKIQRGRGAGGLQQPRTKVQRLGLLLPPVLRPTLIEPHLSPGCLLNPTEGQAKRDAAKAFKEWWPTIPPKDVSIFSDGSEQIVQGTKRVTYGFVAYQDSKVVIAEGRGSLHPQSHVFDGEAVGAWRGLQRVLRIAGTTQGRIWMCIDSTSVINCLKGNAANSSQWAFIECHGAIECCDIQIKWAPGHTGIEGNERADQLADQEAKDPQEPIGKAAHPTISGIRTIARGMLRSIEHSWWKARREKLSDWYRQWSLPYKVAPQEELSLNRPTLARLLAIRTMHGDFAWYHKKFRHDNAILQCSCGKDKSPDHIVHCRRTVRHFHS